MSFPTKEHIDAAIASANYWYRQKGVYSFPSFRLAQTAIESAEGKAMSGKHNYWGVKANQAQIAAGKYVTCKTHEVIKGRLVQILDKFASYDSLEDGYIQQAKLLVTSPYYEKSRHDTNPKQYAIDVGVHYATAPNYAKVVIAYMDSHNLYQYDHPDQQIKEDTKTASLKPSKEEEKKVQVPAAIGGAVIVGSGVAASTIKGLAVTDLEIMIVGTILTLIFAGVAYYRYRQIHQNLAKELTPPTQSETEEVLKQVSAAKIIPVAVIEPSFGDTITPLTR